MNRRHLLFAAATSLALPRIAAAQQATPVRIATSPIDASSEPYYAQAQGFFRSAGLDATISTMAYGAAIASAVAGGAIDVGYSNTLSVAIAHERGVPFVCIAPGNLVVSRVRQAGLLVAATSPIRSARDLTGKTLAVNGLNGIPHVSLLSWIDKNGGSSGRVKIVELAISSMAAAIDAGRIDGGFLGEPQLDDALATKRFRLLGVPYDAVAPAFALGIWFATTGWVQAHPEAARALLAAVGATARWANANQAASAKILAAATGFEVAPNTPRALWAEKLDPAQVQPVIDLAAQYGVLKSDFPATAMML